MISGAKPLAFISYRRQDTAAVSRWLGEKIAVEFGAESVFIDVDAIRVSDEWPKLIEEQLEAATVLIVVIGQQWLRIADEYGRRRLDQDSDWVRREIAAALCRRIRIIPLLVAKATLPPREALPDDLKPLLDFQAIEIRDETWSTDRDHLLAALERAGFVRLPLPDRSSDQSNVPSHTIQRSLTVGQQLADLKHAVELAYRARNTARDLNLTSGQAVPVEAGRRIDELLEHQVSIEQLLYRSRALLPDEVFQVLHSLKHELLGFFRLIDAIRHPESAGSHADPSTLPDLIDRSYRATDNAYSQLLAIVQSHLGIGGQR